MVVPVWMIWPLWVSRSTIGLRASLDGPPTATNWPGGNPTAKRSPGTITRRVDLRASYREGDDERRNARRSPTGLDVQRCVQGRRQR